MGLTFERVWIFFAETLFVWNQTLSYIERDCEFGGIALAKHSGHR